MLIKVIASGSTGNAYEISDGNTHILLECGMPFKKLQQAMKFNISKLSACFVTHEHL